MANKPHENWTKLSSLLITGALGLVIMFYGLLPGLIATCLGVLLTSSLKSFRWVKISRLYAAGIVILLPLVLIAIFMANAKGIAFTLIPKYQELLHHLAGSVMQLKDKLPAELANKLPEGIVEAQTWLSEYLQSKAEALGGVGKHLLEGGVLAYIGMVVGALIVGTEAPVIAKTLPLEMRKRGSYFMASFRQIVVAQFWIATFNTTCTAIFLKVGLPIFGIEMPYAGSLIAFTFFAGLIPIVGNLMCNGVLTIAGVAVSPAVGVSCLVFLIVIHKTEVIINGKVIGSRTATATWELISAMFIAEAIFGMGGLVAAPLFYAYVKKELQAAGLI